MENNPRSRFFRDKRQLKWYNEAVYINGAVM